jgi:alkanesulfonate monooxygenase SsuD/methylene tetrahydromethanopterin reductase-like flavin-dependent oxidoreductase (luciferase family)/DNA-binding GntR family transcriptional regulator
VKAVIVAQRRAFRPLSEDAYDALRAAILGGGLQPGERIVEAGIARQMATSRSPVREAVRKLEHEGLVEYVPRRGTIVVGLTRDDVSDAYQWRAHLEAYGARLAATRASEDQLGRLLEMIQRMRKSAVANDLEGLIAADVEFHRLICEASASRRLVQAWETLNPARWTLVSGLHATDLSLEQIAERHWRSWLRSSRASQTMPRTSFAAISSSSASGSCWAWPAERPAERAERLVAELRFGFCVPVFANPGPAFFRTPNWTALEPAAAVDSAVEAERLGYDSIWVADHLMHGFDDAILEGWTTLAVIAGRTQQIKLGTIHLAQPFRPPALAAKMAASLDALSNGRLILFYDCGWQESEVRAYGLDWPSELERIARMEDGLDLIEALWAAEKPIDFRGRYFSTDGAMCRPGPLQHPRPPIWLGEAHHDAWLDAIVRHADGWNSTPASLTRLRAKLDALRAACDRAGRDFGELELSLEIQVLVAPTDGDVKRLARDIASLPASKRGAVRQDVVAALGARDDRPLSATIDDWLVGTPDEVVSQIREYMGLGISHFMLWFLDFPSLDGLRLFAQRVLPALRSAA